MTGSKGFPAQSVNAVFLETLFTINLASLLTRQGMLVMNDEEKAKYKARLLKEERALYATKEANLINALHDLPGRTSALLAVCGVVATLLASTAVIEVGPAAHADKQDAWVLFLIGGFVIVIVLVGIAVWLTLGALSPVKFAEFEPDTSFIQDSIQDLENRVVPNQDMDAAIDDYMADIAFTTVEENSERLKRKHRQVNAAVWLLKVAFALGIVLFAFGVILKTGGIEATIMRVFGKKADAPQSGNKNKEGNKGQGTNSGGPALKSKRSGYSITSGRIVDVTEQRKA